MTDGRTEWTERRMIEKRMIEKRMNESPSKVRPSPTGADYRLQTTDRKIAWYFVIDSFPQQAVYSKLHEFWVQLCLPVQWLLQAETVKDHGIVYSNPLRRLIMESCTYSNSLRWSIMESCTRIRCDGRSWNRVFEFATTVDHGRIRYDGWSWNRVLEFSAMVA